ncbi:MAG: TetR family transcriptional regulator [Alphaproteobacteria bacterium]|nr:TetR family transcriptional regulator [Alphaproteobacteria bacterium]
MMSDGTVPVRARLVASARALISRHGLRVATARRIAEAAQLSVSLVNYHFTDRHGLICAVYEQELDAHRAWLQDAAGALADGGARPAHFADWLAAFVMRRVLHSDTVALERMLWVNAGRAPGLAAIADAWMEAVNAFAGEIAAQFRLDAAARGLLAEFYLSCDLIVSAAMSDQAGLTLAQLAARRFAARLTGTGLETEAEPDLFGPLHAALMRGEGRAGAAPDHSVSQRIIGAALEIAARDGADAVNHRTLAREAGVPLSATTRHFSSRADILRCAFEQAHGALTGGARTDPAGAPRMTPAELAEGSARSLLTSGGEIAAPFRIMQELVILAQSDPALSGLARSLVATRGETSLAVLRAVAGVDGQITRTDAFVWSLCTFGMVAQLQRLAAPQRADFVRARTLARLNLLTPAR